MIYVLIILDIALASLIYVLYRRLCTLMCSVTKTDKPAPVAKNPPQRVNGDDNKQTNDERRYLEGINAVLSYDISTMKEYIKGVSEE